MRRPVTHGLIVLGFIALVSAETPRLHAQGGGAVQQSAVVPDTPAGRLFKSWLEIFNTGDSASLDAFYKKYQPDRSAAGDMPFLRNTGGLDLTSVEKSDPLHLEFTTKARSDGVRGFGVFDANPGGATVKSRMIVGLSPNASAADFRIDGAERERVVQGAISNLTEYYVFPDVATKMGDTVRARLKRGEYNDIANGLVFANRLTDDFQSVSHDKHLRVNFSPTRLPDGPPAPTPEMLAQQRRQMERMNCGFVRVEQLPNNIGYLKFNVFAPPDFCGATASAAMNFLANTDALIVDMRDNGGGDPSMVRYVSSYLFSARTHLNDLWNRKSGKTEEFWTLDTIPGKRFGGDKPVYVLTSSRTFSGAEEFSYNLKMLKRATIIGETTGGGAHPVAGRRIDEHFIIGVPGARAINPISKTNWEGVGVEPDVKVGAADALATAQKMAVEKVKP
jgi:retinol-binding protein 3